MDREHLHTFGPGYFEVERGVRVRHVQVCPCGEKRVTLVDDEPKPAGPLVTGLSSGERFSR